MQLTCHCGSVVIEMTHSPESLTSCNCSLCHRYGALWGYFQPENVMVKADKKSLQSYSWSDKCIDFLHCKTCGCVTHYLTTKKVNEAKVAVNLRMASKDKIKDLKIKYFDGADTWKYF